MSTSSSFGPGKFDDFGLIARLNLVLDEVKKTGATRVPSEAELCRRLEVDRPRLHRVLQTLSREGLVYQVRSKGWFFPAPKFDIPVSRYNSYTANMVKRKKRPHSEVVGIDQVQSEGVWSWVLDFRRYDGDLAYSLARIRLPLGLTPGLNMHLGTNVSLYQTLQREYGILPERRHTWCEAVAADPIVAEALSVPVASPLLKITHEAWWAGKPFEHTVNLLRGDTVRIRVDLAAVEEETP